jgi:hypothetical protein
MRASSGLGVLLIAAAAFIVALSIALVIGVIMTVRAISSVRREMFERGASTLLNEVRSAREGRR